MTKLKMICYVIGVSQLILGALYLVAPAAFLGWQGLSVPAADMNYPIAMFAARLLVYGAGMFVIARQPAVHSFWLSGMIAIQAIDLAAGIYYTATGIVALENAALPMVNATIFIILLTWLRREATPDLQHA